MPGDFFYLFYIQNIADLYRIAESLVGQGIRELKKFLNIV